MTLLLLAKEFNVFFVLCRFDSNVSFGWYAAYKLEFGYVFVFFVVGVCWYFY